MPSLTGVGTADSSGAVEIDFQPSPQGGQQTGTVQVLNSTAGAKWMASFGSRASSAPLGSFIGANLFGQFTVPPGAQLIVKGTGLTPGVQYQAVWNMNLESSDARDTPPTPYGNTSVNVQGIPGGVPVITDPVVDRLLRSLSFSIPVAPGASTAVLTALNDYAGVVVNVAAPFGAVACYVSPPNVATQPQTRPAPTAGLVDSLSFVFPTPLVAGDTFTVTLISLVGTLTPTVVEVLGVSVLPPSPPLRPDGRTGALASKAASAGIAAVGNTPLVAAPGANLAILLSGGMLEAASAAGAVELLITVGGTTFAFLAFNSAVGSPTHQERDYPGVGVLCDPNTAVTLTEVAGPLNALATCLYDVVVA